MLKIRIIGDERESQNFLHFMKEVLRSFDATVSNVRGPYPNQRDRGTRFYVNVSMPRDQ